MNRGNLQARSSRLVGFYRDQEYFSRLVKTALPIATQSFFMSSLNMVSVLMMGQLGETAVASVGLAEQIFFLLNLLMFGINSGAAIFTAQLWGKGDVPNIRRVLGLALGLSTTSALAFLSLAVMAPEFAIGIYSKDPAVVAAGSSYLRIFGWSFVFTAVTYSFATVLRSTGDVRTPLVVTMSALSFNALLSYLLIFGKFGLPAMGVLGGAISILAARILECAGILTLVYGRKSVIALRMGDLFAIDLPFVRRVLHQVLPVAANELIWSLGITTYNMVYARIGTDSIAAMNIAKTMDNLALVIFFGIGHACAILVGNRIGAGEEEKAYQYAARSLSLGAAGALVMGGLILLFANPLLSLYKVSPIVIEYTRRILLVIAMTLWLRVSNLILFVGVFRSGGDTRFAFFLDAGVIWVVGVPMALLGGFVFHLPIYGVYLLVMGDEITKFLIGMRRFLSRKWIHNLAQNV